MGTTRHAVRAAASTLAVALALAFVQASHGQEGSQDSGYFLSIRQKGQLIWSGRVKDSADRVYDVWICPGYTNPTRYGWEHIKESGRTYGEYIKAAKYKSLRDGSKNCFEWAFSDCVGDFVIEGIPAAWGRYMTVAGERTRKRVFGSIVAYPWAVMEGVVDTSFRAIGGLVGMTSGVVAGAVVVPSYHLLNSGLAGTFNLVVQGVALPVSGYAWNTVISPPLALVGGPRPAPSRADGFWVKMVREGESSSGRLSAADVEAAVAWGKRLLRDVQPYYTRMTSEQTTSDAAIAELRERTRARQQELRGQAAAQVDQLRRQQSDSAVGPGLSRRQQEQVLEVLARDPDVVDADMQAIRALLMEYPPPLSGGASIREKTDPVKRSLEILEDLE